jgi:hypothetical protein
LSPYKPGVRARTAQTAQCLIQQTGVTKSTAQHIVYGRKQLKGTWVKNNTECVRCDYFYWERRLLKLRTNKRMPALGFIGALFVLFVTNNKQTSN